MATLSLKISLDGGKVVKTMQFDPSTTVYDACRIIREKILESNVGEPKDYGLFLTSDEDSKKGIWLEPARTLEHYILRNGDVLEYIRKLRNLRVRMLDGSVKTLQVDDSQVVANLMVVICTRIGITNYDEYGLVREEQKDEQDSMDNKPNFGTLTLRRKNQEKERDAKMEQLRKKLRTDDEVNWVDPALTLREQGIDVTETLLLRRKFFFSDRNVDSRDPVQLGLLYVQARDAILQGTHPITQDAACEFAGIQCQIQFGDHKDEKHIAGFLDPKEFLPASYAKVKGIEKKIFKEHRRHIGLSELDSKVLYTKNARALPTYGVAFFLVKEKMKGKNKLVPRLLGVSKDSVLRLDEKTKDILQTWPLTTVRRWCGSPNTFTLDFGDYSDQYYSVQTTEAEQILQVIAGYIDIILKKQKASEHFGIEGDEGSTMLEDSVSPSKAQILQHESTKVTKAVPESLALPAVVRPGGDGSKSFVVSHSSGALHTTTSGQIISGHTPPTTNQSLQVKTTTVLTEPQRALLSTISSGREIIRETESHLVRATLPTELGHDTASLRWKEVQLDTNKQVVTSHIAAMNAATAQVVTLTSGPTEEVDHTAVGAAITTITSNLPQMTKGVQMIAALMEDDDNGDRLLDATRKLCDAFSDLLKAAEPEAKETRQNLLNAASRVGEASTKVLYTIGEETEENKEVQVTPTPPITPPSTPDLNRRVMKKSYLYRKLSYCYDNFYKVFFGVPGKGKCDYGSDFGDMSDDEDYVKTIKHDDENVYEDIDTEKWYFGKPLDMIQEETDSEYYTSLDYSKVMFKNGKGITINDINQRKEKSQEKTVVDGKLEKKDGSPEFESILENCEGFLHDEEIKKSPLLNRPVPLIVYNGTNFNEPPNSPVLPRSTSEKIHNFKKDFGAIDPNTHTYVNVDFNKTDWKTKKNLAREQFFKSTDSIDSLDEEFSKRKERSKKIECHSIQNDVTQSGPDIKVSGALNMKLINLDKYNRVLTTTETFVENAVASFTKSELTKRKDENFENFIRRSEKFYTSESHDRTTTVTPLNHKPKTEIRIFYNPTFRTTGQRFVKGFCQFCRRRCPRTEEKCCPKCVCLELELKMIWKDNWLNILCFFALLIMLLAALVRCFMPSDKCLNGSDGGDGKCFEFL